MNDHDLGPSGVDAAHANSTQQEPEETETAPAPTPADLGDDGLGCHGFHIAHVRYVDGEDHLRLQLRIGDDRKCFFREAEEPLRKIRHRLQLLASQAAMALSDQATEQITDPAEHMNRVRKAKNRAQQQQEKTKNKATSKTSDQGPPAIPVRFVAADGTELDADDPALQVREALMQIQHLIIGNDTYVVLRNQPTVLKLTVPDPVLAEIPILPQPETEFCTPDECAWRWYRVDDERNDGDGDDDKACVSTTRRYVPSPEDVGRRFRVECQAPSLHTRFAGDSTVEALTTPVVRGPDRSIFARRRALGAIRADVAAGDPSAFRIMTYNVLFDGYTSTLEAKTAMFPYAPPEALKEMYRMQLVFQEIAESNADIISFQEMGRTIFHEFFEPMMAPLGYRALYTGKTGTTHEGCAMLIRVESLEVLEERCLDLSTAVLESQYPCVQGLLRQYPEFAKGLARIPSIAQLVILRPRRVTADGQRHRRIVLVNTHLFYREDADMIRLLQAVAMVREIERIREELGPQETAVVITGDLNAFPETATTHFLLDGYLTDTHRHWREACEFVWDRDQSDTDADSGGDKAPSHRDDGSDESPSSPTPSPPLSSSPTTTPRRVEHSLNLVSACGIPEFTNFAGTFVGTLDYILLGREHLDVRQVFPLFTRAEVSRDVAIPSLVFPSDHISLIADVTWCQDESSLDHHSH